MTFDVGRIRHDSVLMHYSRMSNGSAAPSNWSLRATGDTGMAFGPDAGGSVSYGSNSNEVSYVNAPGASSLASRADHIHRGVTTLSHTSNTFAGPVILTASGSLGVTSPTPGTFNLSAVAGSGGGGGGAAGALVFLEAHTASSSATLDFTTFISGTYDDYLFTLDNVLPATDAVDLRIRVGTGGGPTYDTANNYDWSHIFTYIATSGVEGVGATSFIGVRGSVTNTTLGTSGTVRLGNPASASLWKALTYQVVSYVGAVSTAVYDTGGGLYRSNTALTAIRFYFSSGNVASGTIRVYGIAKS